MASDQEPVREPRPEGAEARREEPDLIDHVDEIIPGAWNDTEHPVPDEGEEEV